MKIEKLLDWTYIPVFKTVNGYIKKGPSVRIFVSPPYDKWWRVWDDRVTKVYDGSEKRPPENWISWGYKCKFCDFYVPVITPEFASKFSCFGEAFGEVSGMNAARRARIEIHSSARNDAIIPALQIATHGKITTMLSATEYKKAIIEQLLQHAEEEKENAEKAIDDYEASNLKRFYIDEGHSIEAWSYSESEDAVIVPRKEGKEDLPRTLIIKKSAIAKIEKCSTGFVKYYAIHLKPSATVKVSKSRKSFIIF